MNEITPNKLDLKKDQRLRIEWSDGEVCEYTIGYLRTMCPCAMCKTVRTGSDPHQLLQPKPKSRSLTILPGNFSQQITVTHAELVGNYALKLQFSDEHDTGIYS